MYCNISIKHAIMGCFFYVISQQIINQKNKYRKPDSFSTSIILFTLYIVLNPLIPERHHKKDFCPLLLRLKTVLNPAPDSALLSIFINMH